MREKEQVLLCKKSRNKQVIADIVHLSSTSASAK